MKIIISGQTPAQKNNKQIAFNRKTQKSFIISNTRVKSWQDKALEELERTVPKEKFEGKVQIDYMFYVKDNVQRDTDNMIASVNDILQVVHADYAPNKRGNVKPVKGTGLIKGDNWQLLRIGSADAEIDKENPRAEITITSVT